MVAVFPGAALYFTGAAGQNKRVADKCFGEAAFGCYLRTGVKTLL